MNREEFETLQVGDMIYSSFLTGAWRVWCYRNNLDVTEPQEVLFVGPASIQLVGGYNAYYKYWDKAGSKKTIDDCM